MRDPKKFVLRKKQGVPNGVDPAKHERCVHDVKEQGHGKVSAIKICNHSLEKACACKCMKCMDFKTDFKKGDYATEFVGCGDGLAGKICRHNHAKLNKFVADRKKMKKSIDFQHTTTIVEAGDQKLAEDTTSPELIQYLKTAANSDLNKIPFAKGMLTLSKREPGLYNGFFQDLQGQVVEKFNNQTIELIAKNMEVKELYDRPVLAQTEPAQPSPTPYHDQDKQDEMEDRIIAREEAQKVVAEAMASLKPAPAPKYIRVKAGDFEIELRKSVRNFVNDFRANRASTTTDEIRKSISTWRKRVSNVMNLNSDLTAAKTLLEEWDRYKEDFNQILFAMQANDEDES